MAHNNQNLLINYIHDKALKKYASLYLNGRMIDIGCGEKPYQDLLSLYITEHVGIDHEATLHHKENINLIGTAYKIPVEKCSFDSAICTSVLEHLEEPELALRECLRVLKPEGKVIYSVPFIWHLHEEPRDFYRFSKYGLKYLFEKAGFEVIEIEALSGFWVTFGQLLVYNLHRLNRPPLSWVPVIDGVGIVIQIIAYILNSLDKTEQWTCLYMVVARKNCSYEP